MSDDYEELDVKRELAAALKRLQIMELQECFDPYNPKSKPTEPQRLIMQEQATTLYQYVMGGNQSGKSSLGGRLVTYFYKRMHPYLDIEALWSDDPMLILVVGRLNNQVEELWERKIKPFLTPSEYRENRQGGTLQYVVNPKNGSKIVFATHNDPVNAREKIQSYTAHLVWLDELTDHLGIIEELQRRVQAKRGRMIVTFTPKIRAEAVRRFIETPTQWSKTYRISMLDNPIYDDRREEIMSQIMSLPKSQQDTILYGEWFVGEQSVFFYDPTRHCEQPAGYTVFWPHIVAVDPAASGLMGYTLWAAPYENAETWYNIAAEYVKGSAPSDLVTLIEAKVKHVNVILRIADTHETWYWKEAQKLKIQYRLIPRKRDRKKELIGQGNQALANGRVRLTQASGDLASELMTAQWSETAEDKIVNASSYHLADCFQYFVDLMPKFKEIETRSMSHDDMLRRANQQRLANEAARAKGHPKHKFRIVAKRGRVWKS